MGGLQLPQEIHSIAVGQLDIGDHQVSVQCGQGPTSGRDGADCCDDEPLAFQQALGGGPEVCVVFDNGDLNRPYVLGGIWNGPDVPPPPGNPDGKDDTKLWQTCNGHMFVLEDHPAGERITLADGPGSTAQMAGLALASRKTPEKGSRFWMRSPNRRRMLGQAPWFSGSSCTHTTGVPSATPAKSVSKSRAWSG